MKIIWRRYQPYLQWRRQARIIGIMKTASAAAWRAAKKAPKAQPAKAKAGEHERKGGESET